MRTLIDIEQDKLQALTELAHDCHISRAALIRKAIDELLSHSIKKNLPHNAFGILKDKKEIEGLSFQKRFRSEWPE